MNRRKFLTWLTCTAAGVAAAEHLDVDQILWTPGAKTIFLPAPKVVIYDERVVSLHEMYINQIPLGISWNWHSTDDLDGLFSKASITACAKAMADRIDRQMVDLMLAMHEGTHAILESIPPPGGESLFNPSNLRIRFPRRFTA